MSNIILLGDMHIGVKASSIPHHNFIAKFLTDLFKYIDDNDIRYLIQLGDMFDVRKHVTIHSLWFINEYFIQEVLKRNLIVYALVGNHDMPFRDSLRMSSVEEILKMYPQSFKVIKDTTEVEIDGKDMLLIPWVCRENEEIVLETVNKSNAEFVFGHFEFNGFEMHRGQPSKTHFTHSKFSKFKKVYSGHYHHKSSKDNVAYIGTPYELTWMDSNDQKGFTVLLENGNDVFIPNRHTIYSRIEYTDPMEVDKNAVSGKYVRLVVSAFTDKKILQGVIDRINSFEPLELKVQENYSVELSESVAISNYKNTIEVIGEYVKTASTGLDNTILTSKFNDLYNRAVTAR
jgi:DNA repair exonuclease SbcCD nuclease subunit